MTIDLRSITRTGRARFFFGIDLGKQGDPTAMALLEEHTPRPFLSGLVPPSEYQCRWLARLPLRTSYVDVMRVIRAVTRSLREDASLVVDATGLGTPIVDMLRATGLQLCAASLHGGSTSTVTRTRGGWDASVAKADAVGALVVALDRDRFRVARDLPLARTLEEELRTFRVKLSQKTGHASYEAEGRLHDDFVLACSLALWWAEYRAPRLEMVHVDTIRR